MTQPLTGDKAQLQTAADKIHSCWLDLGSQLGELSYAQGGLQAAAQSDGIGQKIFSALGNAWEQGKALEGTMGDVMEALSNAGAHIDATDLAGAEQLAREVASGAATPEMGNWSGKIDTSALSSLT
ncbi:hypothetical protein KO481_35580 [Nocardia sp. NEAU-G5]|uniref:Uncharacterized protein n=1 Tax=Nocardia albiluteola TaxID=2842303 RepID=A0ABS6B948_9NOCA|nr:death domain-containing protein [Nocardia albiluteola]MBU3066828.1 hypothetical protein [Nocardia albiluteola]